MRILTSKYFFFYVMLLMMRYQGYDPMDMEKGLCRSYILVWVRIPFFIFPHVLTTIAKTYRHIFTSPSSAMKTRCRSNEIGSAIPENVNGHPSQSEVERLGRSGAVKSDVNVDEEEASPPPPPPHNAPAQQPTFSPPALDDDELLGPWSNNTEEPIWGKSTRRAVRGICGRTQVRRMRSTKKQGDYSLQLEVLQFHYSAPTSYIAPKYFTLLMISNT